MTVSIVANAASGALTRTKAVENTKFSSSVKALIANSTSSGATANDGPSFSAALTLQTQIAGLRSASLNIAQATSALDIASNTAQNLNAILSKLDNLAKRASSADLSSLEQAGLSNEFSALRNQIARLSDNARFNNKSVLDGSLTLADIGLAQDANNEVIGLPDLSDKALLSSANLSIATQSDAAFVRDIIENAQSTIYTALDNIKEFQATLDTAGATIDAALFNQDAARSTLSDEDYNSQSASNILNPQQSIEGNSLVSQQVQTNRLPPSLLQLLVS